MAAHSATTASLLQSRDIESGRPEHLGQALAQVLRGLRSGVPVHALHAPHLVVVPGATVGLGQRPHAANQLEAKPFIRPEPPWLLFPHEIERKNGVDDLGRSNVIRQLHDFFVGQAMLPNVERTLLVRSQLSAGVLDQGQPVAFDGLPGGIVGILRDATADSF